MKIQRELDGEEEFRISALICNISYLMTLVYQLVVILARFDWQKFCSIQGPFPTEMIYYIYSTYIGEIW